VTPEDGIALRGLFIIDKEGVVQHATINNLAFGRSVDETLRTLQAIQYVQSNPDEVSTAGRHQQMPHACPAPYSSCSRGHLQRPPHRASALVLTLINALYVSSVDIRACSCSNFDLIHVPDPRRFALPAGSQGWPL
jgi:hypothetical protein